MRVCKHCGSDISYRNKQALYCNDTCKARYQCSTYYTRHKESILKERQHYFIKNKDAFAKRCAKRYATKTESTPSWLTEWDLFYISELYHVASLRNLQVDHIIPLRGKLVCGLHVPLNLQLLSPIKNKQKSNKYECT